MIIGVDLGGTNIRIGRLKGETIEKKGSFPSPAALGLDESIEYLADAIRGFMAPGVKGIGLGVPSVVDVEKGIVYNVANIPAWVEVPLQAILEKEFGIPVHINNDANCFALGEKWFGEGRLYENIVAITLGTGVGSGLIIANALYNGANTGAGEIGCIKYLDANYETYCSSGFFTARGMTGHEVFEAAESGGTEALALWTEFGHHMGSLIQTTLFAYDPQAIIFGGGIAKAFPYFAAGMYEAMASFPYPESLKNLKILVSRDPDIALLGAAALVRI